MIRRALQLFLLLFFWSLGNARADLAPGQKFALNFLDIDNRKILTNDGHITVLILTTQVDLEKARAVGDRIPSHCLGDPTYRMITLINFQKKRSAPVRMVFGTIVRRRVETEARRLQARYDANKIEKEARRDIFVVTDFDGSAVAQLGETLESSAFRVFIFDRDGALLRLWRDAPSAEELAAVLK